MDAPSVTPRSAHGKRAPLLILVSAVFMLAGLAWLAYWFFVGRFYEYTDDAYVGGNIVQIMPQINGTVVTVGADDTNFVQIGQTLVTLDPTDARLGITDAETKLAKTVRQVRNLFAMSKQLAATVEMQKANLSNARDDLARRESLIAKGAVSAEDLQHAREAVNLAQAALKAAKESLAANQALIDHTTLATHPDVQNAATAVRNAYLTYWRTTLPSPVSGFVAERSAQVGQHVTPGTVLMTVIPPEQIWVDANFKESQLAHMRVGQKATVTADLYGGHIRYRGTVVGFSAGSGSAFALLPAQNATGNWIKIVQRVPVRIGLDPRQLAQHPLEIGLSMRVNVDIHDRGGPRLTEATGVKTYQTDVFKVAARRANQRIAAIIAKNSGSFPAMSVETP